MPNDYSIAIHDHISGMIESARNALETAHNNGDITAESSCRGQLDELCWIREYLKNNIDLKNFTYY